MKAAHNPFRPEQNRKRAGCACRFGVYRRNAAQFGVDLRNKRAELQLLRELTRIEISNRARLNFRRIDFRVIDGLLAGFDDQMPDGFALLLEIALKIGAPTAKDIN